MSNRFARILSLIAAVLAGGVAITARGEPAAEKIDAPVAPYVNKLPDLSHYDLVESVAGKGKHKVEPKGPPHLTRVSVTKTGETRRIFGEWSNGKKLEAWMYGGMVLLQQLEPPDVIIDTLENTTTDLPIGKDDFGSLEWLGAQTYKQSVTLEGKKCFLYERTADSARSGRITLVWIDTATRLPAAMERDGIQYQFQYGSPPTEPLELSPAFAQAWQAYQGGLQSVTATAPRPPFVAKLPDFSRYEMSEIPRGKADPAKDPAATTRMTHAVITKTGTTKQIVSTLGNGKIVEAWMYNGIVLMQQLTPPDIILNGLENTFTDLPVSKDDFKDLNWLSAQNYKSDITFEGNKCYFFEQTSNDSDTKETWRAWIDEKTKLPVAIERRGVVYHFQYDPPPTQALQLSPPFAKAWQNYQASLRSVKGHSAPR